MPVEEAELLSAVRGIVGRIQVNGDATSFAAEPLGVPLNNDISNLFAHAEQLFRRGTVFEARKGRLRTEILAVDRITIEQQFLHGIGSKRVCVVAVGIPRSDSIDALPEKIPIAVDDLAGLSTIVNTLTNTIGERQLIVDRFQENSAAIGTAVGLVEGDRNGLEKFFVKKNGLCGKLSHQKASVCVWNLLSLKYLYASGGFLFWVFANNSG